MNTAKMTVIAEFVAEFPRFSAEKIKLCYFICALCLSIQRKSKMSNILQILYIIQALVNQGLD